MSSIYYESKSFVLHYCLILSLALSQFKTNKGDGKNNKKTKDNNMTNNIPDFATFIIPIEAYENDFDLPTPTKRNELVWEDEVKPEPKKDIERKEFGSAILISCMGKTVIKVKGRDGKEYNKFTIDEKNDSDLIDFLDGRYSELKIGSDLFTKDSWGGVEKNNKFWLSKREVQECQQLFK